MASWFIRASWSWACCGLLQSQGTRSLTPRATRLGAPCPPLVPGGFHSLTGVTRLGDGQPQAAAGPRQGYGGWRMKALTMKLGHRWPKTLSSGEYFSKVLPQTCPNLVMLLAQEPVGQRWVGKGELESRSWTFKLSILRLAPHPPSCHCRGWLVFLQAQAALCGPHQPWVSLRQPPCMFIEGCLLSGREDGKGSIFMLGLFHVLLLPTASV